MKTRIPTRTGYYAFLTLLAIAVLKTLFDLSMHWMFEMRVPYAGDPYFFMTVGRGILNGLTPYADLFETKPPGIFWITSLSLWLTNGMLLAHVLQVVTLIAVPIALFFTAWSTAREELGLCAYAALFSLILGLYTATASGMFFPESFGALFGILYACLLYARKHWRTKELALASCLMLLSFLMKEPFLLSLFAVAILLTKTPREIWTRFLVPLGIAAAGGILLFLVLGYARPYVTAYLPFMTSPYFESSNGPVWLQGFQWHLLWEKLSEFSFGFPFALSALLFFTFATFARRLKRNGKLFLGILLAFSIVFSRALLFIPLLFWPVGLMVAIVLFWFTVNNASEHGRLVAAYELLLLCAVTYIIVLLPGTRGQFLAHHCVFSVPLYVALFLRSLPVLAKNWAERSARAFAWGMAALFALSTFTFNAPSYKDIIARARAQDETGMAAAAIVDDVMDRCGFERYLILGKIETTLPSHTRHSPLGPAFLHEKINILVPFFREQYVENIRTARFAVVAQPVLLPDEAQAAMREFGLTPPECAKGIQSPGNMQFYFKPD